MRQEFGVQFRFDFDRFFRLGVGFRFQRLAEGGLIVPEAAQAGDSAGYDLASPAREEYCVCCPDGSMDCRFPYDCRGPFFSPLITVHGLLAVSGVDLRLDRMRMMCPEMSGREAFPTSPDLPQREALARIFPRLNPDQLRDMGTGGRR